MIYTTANEVRLAPVVMNGHHQPIADAQVTYKITPPDVAATANASVHCLVTGDALITATAGQASHTEPLKCRLVAEIRALPSMQFALPADPFPLAIWVLGADGKPVDVQPTITVTDPTIVKVDAMKVVPLAVGATDVTITAGEKKSIIKVTVMKHLETEAFRLKQGERTGMSLKPGNYQVHVVAGAQAPVTVSWAGGTGCARVSQRTDITTTCKIEKAGSVIIENPAGPAEAWIVKSKARAEPPAAQGTFEILQLP